ncbi:MAG: site-specific DNA-methyltransferase [Rhodospirillales bacterium]|nr:site-specific DNA-methyltransferase [Rhodospirillales bacterium]
MPDSLPPPPSVPILDDLRRFDAFGRATECAVEAGIPYYVNEFWTAGQRRAHAIHEISYRACFKPQLPRFFIARLTAPGEAVHDPFMGRGTTPIEAALLGRRPLGNDINPLAVLLARPRLAPPPPAAVAARLHEIPWDGAAPDRDDLLVFYHPATLARLAALRAYLLARCPPDNPAPDPVDDWIRMVALNRLSGHSPGFFSVRTMPPNQAVSVAAQRRMNARAGAVPPERDVAGLILRKSRALLADGAPDARGALFVGPAEATAAIADATVALTVTSPPFLDVVHYAGDNWLRLWFAGIDPATVPIALHRSEAAWHGMVRAVLAEQARILRPGGHVAFEVGEVRGGRVLLERLVWAAAEGLPFDRLGVMVNRQDFTKTAHCWGVANMRAGTNSNRIVLLRRR